LGVAEIPGDLAGARRAPRAGWAGQSSSAMSYCPVWLGQGSRLECPKPCRYLHHRLWCGRSLRHEGDDGGPCCSQNRPSGTGRCPKSTGRVGLVVLQPTNYIPIILVYNWYYIPIPLIINYTKNRLLLE